MIKTKKELADEFRVNPMFQYYNLTQEEKFSIFGDVSSTEKKRRFNEVKWHTIEFHEFSGNQPIKFRIMNDYVELFDPKGLIEWYVSYGGPEDPDFLFYTADGCKGLNFISNIPGSDGCFIAANDWWEIVVRGDEVAPECLDYPDENYALVDLR